MNGYNKELLTEFSNRYLILNDFTKLFMKTNKMYGLFKYIYYKEGVNLKLLKNILKIIPYITILKNYLLLFVEEELNKRRKKDSLITLKNELLNLTKKIELAIISLEKSYKEKGVNSKDYINNIKNILLLLEKFFDLINKLNPEVGLFTSHKKINTNISDIDISIN